MQYSAMNKTIKKQMLSAAMALCILLASTALLPSSAIFSSWPEPERNRIFMGDSRTVGMYTAVHGGYSSTIDSKLEHEYWIAKEGSGYKWMSSTAIPRAESYGIDRSTQIFILFGVNDLGNQSKYLSTINQKAQEWRQKGARVYFVSVNPVYEGKCRNISNRRIEQFNAAMRSSLSYNVNYVDTYSSLYPEISQDSSKTDRYGLHYKNATYQEIYNTLLAC